MGGTLTRPLGPAVAELGGEVRLGTATQGKRKSLMYVRTLRQLFVVSDSCLYRALHHSSPFSCRVFDYYFFPPALAHTPPLPFFFTRNLETMSQVLVPAAPM